MVILKSPVLKSTVKYSLRRMSKGKRSRSASFSQFWMEMRLKISQNSLPLALSFFVWLSGFLYYRYLEKDATSFQVLLISFTIRPPTSETDLSRFYELCWPIFLEVIIFGFAASALLDQYNPVVVCRLTSEQQKSHTVVIGYSHLGERIVSYLKEHHQPYSVLEEKESLIEDLIKNKEPVVLGKVTDSANIKSSGVVNCKEVFVTTNDLSSTVTICLAIRALNDKCKVYVQIFEHDEVREFFSSDPLRAYTFSTSRWAMNSISEWLEDPSPEASTTNIKSSSQESYNRTKSSLLRKPPGKVLVFGNDNLTKRIVEMVVKEKQRDVYLSAKCLTINYPNMSSSLQRNMSLDSLKEKGRLVILKMAENVEISLSDQVPMEEVTHAFVCWKDPIESSEAVFLAMFLHTRYPHIKSYIRIFDESLANVITHFGATPFSTSSYAFEMLQSEVPIQSGIHPL